MALPTEPPAPAPLAATNVMCPKEFLGTQILNGVMVFVYRGPICGQGIIAYHYTTTPLDPIGGDCPAENCLNPVVVGRYYDDLDEEERRDVTAFLRGQGPAFANPYSAPMIPSHETRFRGMPEYAHRDSLLEPNAEMAISLDRLAVKYDQLDGSCTNAILMRVRRDGDVGAKATLYGVEIAPDAPVDETARLVMKFGYCDVVECRGEHYTVIRRGRVPRVRRANLDLRNENFWSEFHRLRVELPTTGSYAATARGFLSQRLTDDGLVDELRRSVVGSGGIAAFATCIRSSADGPRVLTELAIILMKIADRHLTGPLQLREAFEAFGQGVLYDARPPSRPGRRIHMMEGNPGTWNGYHRWYALFRAVAVLGDTSYDWLNVARCVGLAWAVQSEARPVADSPENPGLTADRLVELRRSWFQFSFDQLDWAFSNHAGAAPSTAAFPPPAVQGRYAAIQQMLSQAAGDGAPDHDGRGRFWELPWLDFMNLGPVHGHGLIAPPGPNRGANSALVAVLRGTLQGVPRMPMSREPLSETQIAVIEQWINDGCPEF